MQDLPFTTLTQFVALGVTLIAGWFLGLASRSGGGKWRDRYHDVELEHAGYRDRAENDLRDANRRIRDLEAENAKLRAGAPVAATAPAPAPAAEPEGHSTATVVGAAVAGAAAGAAVTHAVEHHDAPKAADHAEPAHAAPAPAEPAPAEPAHPDTHAADAPPAPADSHH